MIFGGIESFIPVVSALQDVFAKIGQAHKIEFPQIVFLGSQSSGKSSVLESIVKRNFLPRGNGMVTRAPLILHLVHTPENDPRRKDGPTVVEGDWAVFDHKESQKYTNFDQVRKEIEDRTNHLTQNTKCITDTPIILRVFSHRVVDLSLVDLPGIIKVAVEGQPTDIDLQIEDLVYKYIRNPNSIILAVTPANVDVATSDALKYAKEVDPKGDRTLAVLTKLDLMDEGTNAIDMLTGKVIEVKLGIIGVKLRSQADITNCKSMDDCLKDEERFLLKYYSILASKNGVKFLEAKLHEILMNHIRDSLPQLKQNISSMVAEISQELVSYADDTPEKDKNSTCLRILKEYEKLFDEAIEGNITTDELMGGSRILNVFFAKFLPKLCEIDPRIGLTEKDILTAVHNATGAYSPLLTPEEAFKKLVKRQIQYLEAPCLICIKLVFEELTKIAETCYHKIIKKNPRYPKLCEKIYEVVSDVIRNRKDILENFVKDLVANELAYINTRHPDFKQRAQEALARFLTQDIQEIEELKDVMLVEEGAVLKFAAVDMKHEFDPRSLMPQVQTSAGLHVNGLVEVNIGPKSTRQEQHPGHPQGSQPMPTSNQPVDSKNSKKNNSWFGSSGSNGAKNGPGPGEQGPHQSQHGGGPHVMAQIEYAREVIPPPGKEVLPVGQNGKISRPMANHASVVVEKKVVLDLTEDDKRNLAIVEYLICNYFAVVRKNLLDMVPKTIMRLLVNYAKDELYHHLVKEITLNPKILKKLLNESPKIKARKKELLDSKEMLTEAITKLAQIQDVSAGYADEDEGEDGDDGSELNGHGKYGQYEGPEEYGNDYAMNGHYNQRQNGY